MKSLSAVLYKGFGALTLLMLALMVVSAATPTAEAAFDSCRTDPVLLLSDLSIMDVSASVGTSVSNLQSIKYTLHLPPGVSLLARLDVPTLGFRGKEFFTTVSDSQPGRVSTETRIESSVANVDVIATSTYWLQVKSIAGYSGQNLFATFKRGLLLGL